MPPARRPSKQASHIFLSCAAGGIPALIAEGVKLSAFERVIGLPLHKLVQCVSPTSAGTIASAPLFIRHPEQPGKALLTAEESLQISKKNAAQLLKNSWKPQDVQKILESHIGEARMKDYFGSQIMPLHDNNARTSHEQAKLFYRIRTRTGEVIYEPGENTLVTSVIQASSAVPLKFKSVHIGDQQFCDFGHLHEAARAVALYSRKSGVEFERIKFVEVGPPRFQGPSSSNGVLSGLHMLFNQTSNHSFSSSIEMVRTLLGEENTHLLHVEHNNSRYRSNVLNPSDQHIKQIEALTQSYLEHEGRDSFNRVCDLMIENHAIRSATRMQSMPAVRQPSILESIFGGKRQSSDRRPPNNNIVSPVLA